MANTNNDIISTSPSKLDIYTKLLDIAGKYTDIENTDYLKSGLFGYIAESMAMMIRDSSYHKAMLYNESFLNTAIIPQSVYNWAKMFNIDVAKATPAYATIRITINKDDLESAVQLETKNREKYGSDLTVNDNFFIIDKSNMIIAGEYYFSLEHSILVRKVNNSYKASYITTENATTNYQEKNTKNLPIIYNNGNYEIEARAYQYRTVKIERQMSSTRMLNKVQLFNFEDQYAGARLYYKENSISTKKEIALLYSNIGTQGNENVAYYNLNSSNELEIVFKGGSEGFVPSANSRLMLEIYTTKGSNVPNNFTGTAVFKFGTDDELRKYGIVVSFNPTNILGGADVPSVEKIKQTIIKQLSTCNTIVTESDLNNYFEILTSLLESVNDGKVTFVKRRDDILRRVFNSYILLRDGEVDDGSSSETDSSFISKCVPTNTISAYFDASNFIDDYALIYPKITLDANTQQYIGRLNDDSTTSDYYFSPFYIFVTLSPVKKIKYIYNLTDNSSTLNVENDNIIFSNEGNYLNPVSCRVFRLLDGSTAESQYHFEFKFSSNIETLKGENIKIGVNFGDTTIVDSISDYDEEYSPDNNILKITANVKLDDTANEFKFSDKGMKILLAGKECEESAKIKLTLANTKNEKNVYYTDDSLYLFRSLDEIMLSDISVNTKKETLENGTEKTTVTGITIYDIPVVHSSYVNNDHSKQDKFVKQLFTYITLLKENLEKLETSTFFDLKFYNTYGPSQLYNTTTTNVELSLDIYLNSPSNSLREEIRSYIRRAVDKSNENGCLKVSQIISLLSKNETYGQYIDYIEFAGLNGTFSQYIEKNFNSEENVRDYPPEWLNLDATKIKDSINFK